MNGQCLEDGAQSPHAQLHLIRMAVPEELVPEQGGVTLGSSQRLRAMGLREGTNDPQPTQALNAPSEKGGWSERIVS